MLAVALLAVGTVGSTIGCSAAGLNRADPLTPQADMARRGVPMPAQVPREFAKTVLPTYRLAPGDTVLVEPARFDTPLRFPADQPVQPDGTIDLGRFGRVAVAGLSVAEVEGIVAERVALVADRDESLAQSLEDDPSGGEVN
ncbi:MAG: polysaccharide biosynthesis/export family protein, partial [Planctomycetota bacterium]